MLAQSIAASSPVATQQARGTWQRAGWSALALIVLTLFQLVHIPKSLWNVLWAEDGAVFIGDALAMPQAELVFADHGGYLHLIPRLIAEVVVLLPTEYWALAMTLAATTITSAICVSVFWLARDVVASPFARAVLALVPVIMPITYFEVVGNATNLHWWLVWLAPWLMLRVPRNSWGLAGLVVVSLAVAATAPLTIIWVVLALLQARSQRSWFVFAGFAVGWVAQFVTMVLSGRKESQLPVDFGFLAQSYAANTFGQLSGDPEALGRFAGVALLALSLCVLLVVAGSVVYLLRSGTTRLRILAVYLPAASVVLFALSFWVNFSPRLTQPFGADFNYVRYGFISSVLLISVVPLAVGLYLDRTKSRNGRITVVVVVSVAVTVCAVATANTSSVRDSRTDWAAGLATASSTCVEGSAKIPISPYGSRSWVVVVPCDRLPKSSDLPSG